MGTVWERRIKRAEELQQQWPFAQEILRFFRAVTSFQQELYHRLQPAPEQGPMRQVFNPGGQLNTSFLASFFPSFLALVEKYGPPDLSALAQKFKDRQEADWERTLRSYWNRTGNGGDLAVQFFPKAILQPYTVYGAERWREEVGAFGDSGGSCPFCSRPPVVSLLSEDRDNEAIARTLVCSLCSTEWSYPRIQCPSCQEDRPEKLPRYTAHEIPWMRVEGCDSCHHYLKAVDVRKNPAADPVADEIGSTVLDIVARERNYTKLEVNIVGV